MQSTRKNVNPTLVINAGGESRRMGQSKALLPVPPDNRPLIARIAHRLSHLAPERIVVVANDPAIAAQAKIPGPVDFLPDRYPGTGTLGGIATALQRCDEWVILVACVMPLVNPALFEWLWSIATTQEDNGEPWDAVVPHVDGYGQTMHALYHRRCLPAIEARLAVGDLKVAHCLSDLRVRGVSEEEIRPLDPFFRSFLNVNTPHDWTQALEMMQTDNCSTAY